MMLRDDVAEVCLKFGVPLGRANLVAAAVVEIIENPNKGICENDRCGKQFRYKHATQRFCSDACRVVACNRRQTA